MYCWAVSGRKQQKAIARYQALRTEVMELSPAMAAAMLSGLDLQLVVTGQYTNNKGGACPLLAAKRAGAPLHLQTNFPRTWDLFCQLKSSKKARAASRHELSMLRMLLAERTMPAEERSTADHKPSFRPPRPRRLAPAVDWQAEFAALCELSASAA